MGTLPGLQCYSKNTLCSGFPIAAGKPFSLRVALAARLGRESVLNSNSGGVAPCHNKQCGTRLRNQHAATGAVTLIQRFGSAANLNTHLHALVLDGVYQTSVDKAPVFHPAAAPSMHQLQTLLGKIIRRIMKLLTRQDYLIEEDGITYLARTGDTDPDNVLAPLQAASSTWRIAQGPRAGRKVLTLVGGTGNELREARQPRDVFCANAEDRQGIEQLCRYITRPAISNERLLRRNPDVSFGSGTDIACGSKLPFDPTFSPTSADPRIAALRGSDRQRQQRPSCGRRASGRYRSRAVAQMTSLSRRWATGIGRLQPLNNKF